MSVADRFQSWIETTVGGWKDDIRGWVAHAIENGVTKFIEVIEPDAIDNVRSTLTRIHDDPNTPDDVKNLITRTMTPGHPLPLLLVIPFAIAMILPVLFQIAQPLARLFTYQEDKLLHSFRLDPGTIVNAWLRDKPKYDHFYQDLRDQGWPEDRIDAVKELSNIIPGVQDLIRMSVREAFSPEIAEKFGQYQDPPTSVYPWAQKLGLSQEWVDRYWAAHWELPSSSQGFELLHRKIITEDELKLLLRALDVMPYWRDKLIQASWNVPTRVDVRRFWDLRTIDEARLREVYTAIGYHGQDLEDYVLWTKIFVDFPDLLARYKNGWITLDQVKSELIAMGMKPERADTLIEEKIKKSAPERTADELKLTLSDIYKGVKQDRISRDEGIELIQYLGSTEWEAEFKLLVNVPPDEEDKAKEERLLTKADILSGLKEGVITREQARAKFLEIRYSLANAELLLKIFDAQVKPPVEPKLKEASKADIVLGVKKGVITQEEGYMMLLNIDFSPEAAVFILTVQTEESPFSPINYAEFYDRTQKYRLAAGMEGKPMTEEIKKLGAEVVRLTTEVAALEKSIKDEQGKLVPDTVLPAEATVRVKELQATLYKAQTELIRVKTDYNAKVAEWRHAIK